MNLNNPPTLEELLETHQKVSQDIIEAEKLFGSEGEELLTMRTALKHIEEKIEELRALSDER